MADIAGDVAPPEPAAQEPAEQVDPDWFHQIPFNPRKGLNSVLPRDLPDQQSRRVADAAEENG